MRTVTQKVLLMLPGGGTSWVEVKGYPLNKLRPPFKFFVHRTWDAFAGRQERCLSWRVVESITGRVIGRGGSKKQAIQDAKTNLSAHTDEAFGRAIAYYMMQMKGTDS